MAESDPAVPRVSERRKYDLVGNVPQWIAAILLSIIGVLILGMWSSMERRVTQLETRLDSFTEFVTTKSSEIETLKLKTTYGDTALSDLKAQQNMLTTAVNALTTEVRVLSGEVKSLKGR